MHAPYVICWWCSFCQAPSDHSILVFKWHSSFAAFNQLYTRNVLHRFGFHFKKNRYLNTICLWNVVSFLSRVFLFMRIVFCLWSFFSLIVFIFIVLAFLLSFQFKNLTSFLLTPLWCMLAYTSIWPNAQRARRWKTHLDANLYWFSFVVCLNHSLDKSNNNKNWP